MSRGSKLTSVQNDTLEVYESYLRAAEADPIGADPFVLWSDTAADSAARVAAGKTVVARLPAKPLPEPPHALIHDWIGAVRVEGATVAATLRMLQDYDNHKAVYPEVTESKLVGRSGDVFEIYLRLEKKKVITVVLDTWHTVRYGRVDGGRAFCRSSTTRISEIEHAGADNEFAHLPGTGHGFLWGMGTHWKFEERGGGVIVECRAISLTRDIPAAVGWIVSPMLHKLPAESLKATLEATRAALTP